MKKNTPPIGANIALTWPDFSKGPLHCKVAVSLIISPPERIVSLIAIVKKKYFIDTLLFRGTKTW